LNETRDPKAPLRVREMFLVDEIFSVSTALFACSGIHEKVTKHAK
jgi:hypothetical protein